MLSNETVTTPRPRPPAKSRRTSATKAFAQASPPPPYASSFPERERKPSYLGSPLPATLQSLRLGSDPSSSGADEENADTSWLSEKSREELAELLVKADDLIKERETELGVTSAVCKTLYDSNVTLRNKHDALVARIPPTPRHSPPPTAGNVPFPGGMHSQDNSFDGSNFQFPARPRRISVSPRDISLLADQNAELLQKLETLESEALTTDRSGRRALKQLEREIQLLRDELERAQARSEELEKNVQVGTEKIVEEMWRKKKEREAKFRAMRKNNSGGRNGGIRDFAPPGFFAKASLSPSNSSEFPSDEDGDDSFGSDHTDEHSLVSQLLSKIQELEDTNTRIIEAQRETGEKLHAVQRETESISKVYEYFSGENGVEWEVVDEDGHKSPMEGTVRFTSFRRSLDAQPHHNGDGFESLLTLPRKPRKSVMNLFDAGNEAGPSHLSFPSSISSLSELSPLRYDHSQSPMPYNMSPVPGGRPSLQSELGSDFGDDADPFVRSRHNSLYDIAFSASPSPTPNNLSLRSRISDARATRNLSTPDSSMNNGNALQLNVEPPTPFESTGPDPPASETGSLREKNKDRYNRMSQTLLRRTSRWVDGRFSTISSSGSDSSSGTGSIGFQSTPRPSLPQRLSSALDLVMENFTGPATVRAAAGPADDSADASAAVSSVGSEGDENTVVLGAKSDSGGESGEAKKAMLVKFVLELWLWLQFAIIIVVFLWAMAKRGPKSVLGEADRRAVVRRR